MRISVIGCGYLGAVHAAAMAHLGHDVVGIDLDERKIALLSAGESPFFEPGLSELLADGIASGRLRFSTSIEAARGSQVHFMALGTPQSASGSADLSYLLTATADLLLVLREGDLVVGKSTVPVGTAAHLSATIEAAGATLAWNPEFLREGHAVSDTISPDRLVYGVRAGDTRSADLLDGVYASILAAGTPRMVTDFATAELVKVAANAFLATKISFINAMAEIAEVAGADVTQLADAIGQDARIGRRFLNAGLGFGGGCLPKDIRAFMARADELGVGESLGFLREVDAINLRRRDRVVELTQQQLGGSVEGRRVAVLGLAFKPDSDDVRDSPALDVACRLVLEGARVAVTDPEAIETSRRIAPSLDFRADVLDTATDAEVVLVLTEWKLYRDLDPAALGAVVAVRTVIDARACLPVARWTAAGWTVITPGRPVALPVAQPTFA
jgi:UDPglucose 6-dehydrogenase